MTTCPFFATLTFNMQRTIHGPEQEHLTADECAAWLGVGMTLFDGLVKAGDFPPPLRMGTRKAKRWPWMDVVAYDWLRSRMATPDARRRP